MDEIPNGRVGGIHCCPENPMLTWREYVRTATAIYFIVKTTHNRQYSKQQSKECEAYGAHRASEIWCQKAAVQLTTDGWPWKKPSRGATSTQAAECRAVPCVGLKSV